MSHFVKFTIPTRRLGKSDIEFEVWEDNARKIGTLLISKGAILWKQGSYKNYGYKMIWRRFNDFMLENGRRVKLHKSK